MPCHLIHALLACLLLAACGEAPPAPVGAPQADIKPFEPIVEVKLGSEVFRVETARTDEQHRQGLMHRQSLPDNGGMIFVYPDADRRSMWMKNTSIPLEVVWIDANRRVTGIDPLAPHDLTSVRSPGAVRWSIELPRGAAERVGLKVGDVIEIPAEAR